MRTLLISCGNPLRGDDAVAHEALRLLLLSSRCEFRNVHQLTPELAAELGNFDQAVFLDADPAASEPHLEPVSGRPSSTFTHFSSPAEIVALARVLYHFEGPAHLCRIPAADFAPRQRLSPAAQASAAAAAGHLRNFLLSA